MSHPPHPRTSSSRLCHRSWGPLLSSLVPILLLPSCSDIVFATRTSVGLEVTGDASRVPSHVNFGFRRRELIYAGPQAPKDESMLGRIDSETSWTEGAAIRETLATGEAAEIIADPSTPPVSGVGPASPQPLVFASRTRVGLGIGLGGAEDDALPTGYLGYSRRIATRVKTGGPDSSLPSVVADVSVNTSGLLGGNNAPTGNLHPDARLSEKVNNGGARIRQFFAIGEGARDLLTPAPGATRSPTQSEGTAEVLRDQIIQNSSQ